MDSPLAKTALQLLVSIIIVGGVRAAHCLQSALIAIRREGAGEPPRKGPSWQTTYLPLGLLLSIIYASQGAMLARAALPLVTTGPPIAAIGLVATTLGSAAASLLLYLVPILPRHVSSWPGFQMYVGYWSTANLTVTLTRAPGGSGQPGGLDLPVVWSPLSFLISFVLPYLIVAWADTLANRIGAGLSQVRDPANVLIVALSASAAYSCLLHWVVLRG